jgi:hypothetical protein
MEAELISYTGRAQAARFIQLLLEEITNATPTPVMFEDNAGCIFLIRNKKTGSRTRYVAVQYLFGRELYQNRLDIPYFVKSEANWSDGCTKNLPLKLFQQHEEALVNGVLATKSDGGCQEGTSFDGLKVLKWDSIWNPN